MTVADTDVTKGIYQISAHQLVVTRRYYHMKKEQKLKDQEFKKRVVRPFFSEAVYIHM